MDIFIHNVAKNSTGAAHAPFGVLENMPVGLLQHGPARRRKCGR
jgi:hypothetical protein